MRERREKVRARERSPRKERVYREREIVQGDAGLRVRRRNSRRRNRGAGIADAGVTDARFETGVQVRTRGERRRGRGSASR